MRRRRLSGAVLFATLTTSMTMAFLADASAPLRPAANFVDMAPLHQELDDLTQDPRWNQSDQTGALCRALFDVAALARSNSTSADTIAKTAWYLETGDRDAVAAAFIAATSHTELPFVQPVNAAFLNDARWAEPQQRGPLCRVLFETRGVMPEPA